MSFHLAAAAAVAVTLATPTVVPMPAHAAPKAHTVVIDKMAFGPAPTGVRVGDIIVWKNGDIFRHTATARDKSFDVDLTPGGQARTVLKKPGMFDYYCRYHPGMTGRIVVAP